MKDTDLVKALDRYATYLDGGGYGRDGDLVRKAIKRLEELTKAPEPHPQQQWNVGRKNPEDYNA